MTKLRQPANAKKDTPGKARVNGKLDGLQLGRAIAVLAVVLAHAVGHPLGGSPGILHLLARYGVALFFVISGFIMVLTTGAGSTDPRRFMLRRIRRIVPIYYAANLVLIIATLAFPVAFRSTIFDIRHIILSLLFIPAYRPDGSDFIFPFFRLGWTLNYEMFFYLCFAACFALSARKRVMVLTAFFSMLMLIGLVHPFTAAIPRFYTQVDLLGFIAGIWLGLRALDGAPRLSSTLRRLVLASSLLAFAALAVAYESVRNNPLTQLWLIAICAAQILLLTAAPDEEKRQRRVPAPLLLIGDASYSIYLFHMFAIGIVTAFARRLPDAALIPMMGVALVAGVGAGIIAYRVFEAPLMARFARLGRRGASGAPLVPPVSRESASQT